AALARRAAEDAVEAWAAVVAESGLREDELELARVSLKAAGQAKDSAAADERVLLAAGAFERAGRLDEAQSAYARISQASPRFCVARFGTARCRQKAWQQREAGMSATEAARLAGGIVRGWGELADQLGRGVARAGRAVAAP